MGGIRGGRHASHDPRPAAVDDASRPRNFFDTPKSDAVSCSHRAVVRACRHRAVTRSWHALAGLQGPKAPVSVVELREDIGPLRRRTAFLFLLVFGALGLLHMRLVDLQLVHGLEWRDLAENNRLRRLPMPGPRGWIYDRRGDVLAENIPSWELLLFPDESEDLDATGLFVAQVGITDIREFKDRIAERRIGRMAPLVVGEDLSWNQVAAVRAHQSDYPELTVVNRFRRHYPYGALTAHVVGHLRPVSKETVDSNPGIEADSMVGATGIEAAEDEFIAGRAGERWVMVSAVGRQLGVVSENAPRAGHDVPRSGIQAGP